MLPEHTSMPRTVTSEAALLFPRFLTCVMRLYAQIIKSMAPLDASETYGHVAQHLISEQRRPVCTTEQNSNHSTRSPITMRQLLQYTKGFRGINRGFTTQHSPLPPHLAMFPKPQTAKKTPRLVDT